MNQKIVDIILNNSNQIKEDFKKRAKIYELSGINLDSYEKNLVATYIDLIVDLVVGNHAAWRLHSEIQMWLRGYIHDIDFRVSDGGLVITKDRLISSLAKRIAEIRGFMESRPLISELFGMDTSNYESGVYTSLIKTIVGVINIGGNKKTEELILNLIEWWIFESVEKVIFEADKTESDVNNPEDLIRWILKEKELILKDNNENE